MGWSNRTIRDNLGGVLSCRICGGHTNGMLMLREWDSGECAVYCREHSRQKEWREWEADQEAFSLWESEVLKKNKREVLRELEKYEVANYYMQDENELVIVLKKGEE